LVRFGLTTYYDYRISNVTSRLEELHKEREVTIEKLKAATKYNSTQELLEKYGGGSPGSTPGSATKRKSKGTSQGGPSLNKKLPQPPARVSMVPPATANIPRNNPPSLPATPLRQQLEAPRSQFGQLSQTGQEPQPSSFQPGPPEFAPNAFPGTAQYTATTDAGQTHWYDRVLDLLLGEDETLPKNRMALVCQKCRLVNGQAPPGVKTLEELGKWRCSSCGSWNGETSEAKKIIGEVQEQLREERQLKADDVQQDDVEASEEDAVMVSSEQEEEDDEGMGQEASSTSRRAPAKSSGKKKA
jgi:hypothetical protein